MPATTWSNPRINFAVQVRRAVAGGASAFASKACAAFGVVTLAVLSLSASSMGAQVPGEMTSPHVATIADSVAAAGDSSGAYRMLEAAVKENRRDASAWHQLGRLSWNMARSKQSGSFIRDQKAIKLLMVADSALRMATQLAPDSARFWLTLAKFNLASGVAVTRFAAEGQSNHALQAAERTGDSLYLAYAVDELGMSNWRRFELSRNRALTSAGELNVLADQRQHARDYLSAVASKIEPPTGDADYAAAFEMFVRAARILPTNQRINRHLFMAFAERNRWTELRDIAGEMVKLYPLDFQSWQALGLAAHRLGDEAQASVAFDSAEAMMDDVERERMTQLTRILRTRPLKDKNGRDMKVAAGDAKSFLALEEGSRKGLEQMFWMMSDPLALTGENEFRLEFLSRVVYADFRFSNEDLNLRGADTDRGDIYVRFGPPEVETTYAGSMLTWMYPTGMVFYFNLVPGFATARIPREDQDYVEQVIAAAPVRWDNVATTRLIDTIPIRIARFRAAGDSLDAVVAVQVPLAELVNGLRMDRVAVDVDFRLYDQFVKVRGVESVQSSIAPDSARGTMARTWTRRLGPGINVVRVEALQLDSKRAARAMTRLDPEPSAGFGMSDILLGNKPEPRSAASPVRRWNDVEIAPNPGIYAVGSSIGLLWEMYDVAAVNGQSKYRVSVRVDRADRQGLAGFAGRLVDGIGNTLGRGQAGRNNLTITFDRAVAAAPSLVEFLSLDLSDAAAAEYRLRIEVTDLATGKKSLRETDFRIR